MKAEGGRRKERRTPARLRATGWSRVTLVIVLFAAVLAVVAWNMERAAQTTPPVTASRPYPEDKAPKPAAAAAADLRDAPRERPERERTGRPGQKP
jgi:hypothetical protein